MPTIGKHTLVMQATHDAACQSFLESNNRSARHFVGSDGSRRHESAALTISAADPASAA